MKYTKEEFKKNLDILRTMSSMESLNEIGKGRLEMAEKVEKLILKEK